MPTPSVHTRITLSSLPIDAAIPAAKPSASLMIATGASIPWLRSCAASISAMRAPFNCGRFGASSTTPLRTNPGTPTPTAVSPRSLPAAAITCWHMVSTIPSAGISTSAYSSSCASGNDRSPPDSAWSTTNPATTRSDKVTPTIFAIATPLLELAHAIQSIESRYFITFREGWIVEDRIHEIVQRSTQRHHRLRYVQQLACFLADDVYAEDRVAGAMEDQLEPPCGVATNLATRNLAIISHAHLVWHILFRELFLRLADKADLRNRINPIRIEARVRQNRLVSERPRRRNPPLLHRHRSQRREPDHIAGREHIRHLRTEVLIHRNPAAPIRLYPDRSQIQLIDVALAPDRIQQCVALHLLLALEICDHGAVRHLLHRLHLFIQTHRHARIAQVIAQRLDDLLVGKLQQPGPPLDQRHPHAERGKHARILDADHPAPDRKST